MKRITEQPWKGIIDREWMRAKRILPVLKRKPKVCWADGTYIAFRTQRSGCVGCCDRYNNRITIHEGFAKRTNHKEFVQVLRHEFAHLPKPSQRKSHGADFKWWCNKLGGTRHSTSYEYELSERIPRKGSRQRWHYEQKRVK